MKRTFRRGLIQALADLSFFALIVLILFGIVVILKNI